MMECNRDEALRAREIAEKKFTARDAAGAKKFALKAQDLYPALDGISQMIATLDVHLASETVINGERDWYAILGVNAFADDEIVKKQYRKLALMLHPDKNKSVGAEAAFKLVSEAWSVLCDKTRRLAYDQKRNVKATQNTSQPHTSSNGFFHFSNNVSSSLRKQKNSARAAASAVPPPAQPPRPSTFWTSCHRCKMQYEYLRVYLNHNLLCPNCHEPFLAIETGNPTNGHNPPTPWSSTQQRQTSIHNRNSYRQRKNSSSAPARGSASAAAYSTNVSQAVNVAHQTYGEVRREDKQMHGSKRVASFIGGEFHGENHASSNIGLPEKRIRGMHEDGRIDHSGNAFEKVNLGQVNSMFNANKVFKTESVNGISVDYGKSRIPQRQSSSFGRELSILDIRSMLMRKAQTLVRKKLEDWGSEAAAKLAEEEIAKQKQKQKQKQNQELTIKEINSTVQREDGFNEIQVDKFRKRVKQVFSEKESSDKPSIDSNMEVQERVSIYVPDPDFHDFDKDRSERSFEPDQVWATYDDEDGMPRLYVLVQKVLSLKPFKIRMSFLNSKSNSEFGPLNWVSMGFAKTCGDFRVSRYEINDSINIFSHKVKWEKGARGVIKIHPKKGDTWALYKNWSPEWNEHTPDDLIYKYDMVEVLDDYSEEQGVPVTPLVKVAGFKTVFHRHLDPKEVKRIPKEEMFRFSHQVPSCFLTGTEAPGAPEGCHELDPAATPLELLQVITEAKEDDMVETSQQKQAS